MFLAGLDRRSLSDPHLHRLITEKGVKTEAKEYIHSLKPLQLARDVLTTFLGGEHQNTGGSDEAVKVEKELEWDRKKALAAATDDEDGGDGDEEMDDS